LSGGAPGPGCTAASSATEQVVILNATAPPAPFGVRARPGAAPGSLVVTWKAAPSVGVQAQAEAFEVSAAPVGTDGVRMQCRAPAPDTSCTLTGLRAKSAYAIEVRALATIWLGSSPGAVPRVSVPAQKFTGPARARFCAGSEVEVADQREVRPPQVILDCDAYGPQYGVPPVRTIDGITWSSWTSSAAVGVGMLHWQGAKACPPGSVLANCGVETVDVPVTIRLANPQPMNRARTRYAFTEVGLYPSGTGPDGCRSTCWFTPARVAYQ